nr:methylenetetrahydrofolate--tRNA-(uracil(54)-C(5))-methyltransferase (FADH(2)-oxidizing) TrmFO [Chrysiogenes arsenatis]
MTKAFFAARYGKGDADYLNCPMNQEEYRHFHQALVTGERVKPRDFEKEIHFEGCMPVEEMADRGVDTLRYGPLKPVGLDHPITGEAYYAVVQLRKETATGNMYNLVGFQTKLTYAEQQRVFRLIPGLEQVEFFRLGSMHRNTYINAPMYLTSDFRVRQQPNLWLAGQISGVEGYIESIASGLVAAWSVLSAVHDQSFTPPPPSTAIGALCQHIVTPSKNFQPMNINFGLFETLPRHRKLDRKNLYGKRAQEEFPAWLAKQPLR